MVAPDKRYVPKGGYLVDFEKRVTPKLKRLMAKESGDVKVKEECTMSGDTPSSECMALVLWNGGQPPAESSAVVEHVTQTTHTKNTSQNKTHWKPPGCLKRQLWKRPASWARSAKKKNQHMDDKAPPVSVDDEAQKQAEEYLKEERCILEKEREKLAEQQDMAQRKMIQAESLMSKCSREMKEFQAYKEEEMENIRQMKVSVKQRRIRDKLAGASEARGSLHHAEIAKLRVQIEEFEAALKDAKAKGKAQAQKHHVEIAKYKEREKTMEEEIMHLQETLAKYRLTSDDVKKRQSVRLPSTPDEQPCPASTEVIKHGIVEEIKHPNNTVERRWANGSKQFVYENGDVRQTFDSQVVQYYYSSIDCWNTSYPNGDHVIIRLHILHRDRCMHYKAFPSTA
ncbi:hypothetical protein M9435_000388 [Picochlorum sp. BPE23]|nr:hypothetical protein M9435_000388 [Picochlorum sp. BPE23]